MCGNPDLMSSGLAKMSDAEIVDLYNEILAS
jgi:hypothetical protein